MNFRECTSVVMATTMAKHLLVVGTISHLMAMTISAD